MGFARCPRTTHPLYKVRWGVAILATLIPSLITLLKLSAKDSNPVDEHCGETFKQIEESSEVKITHNSSAALLLAGQRQQHRRRAIDIVRSGRAARDAEAGKSVSSATDIFYQ